MPTTPPQLEALVNALPKLSEDALRTVLEVCVARMKVRASCASLCSCLRHARASRMFARVVLRLRGRSDTCVQKKEVTEAVNEQLIAGFEAAEIDAAGQAPVLEVLREQSR